MRIDNLSLSITNTEVSDEGRYTCEVVHGTDTVIRYVVLQVLVQPYPIYLTLTSDGSPVCGAIGGNPPAEISWIPHLDNINTTVVEEPDQTWSVISTLRRKGMNETSVTCVVSHPTLENPWKKIIVVNAQNTWIYKILGCVISFLVILACLIIWKLPYLRDFFKKQMQNDRGEDKLECEPYETFTQNDNVIYWVATRSVTLDNVAANV
ncbi:cell surface glycoprotein CD200 receptor 1-A-like [Dendropsophus ebraccatus]|uniref:cell surface glycoprotein CD200 receptor 1-A-like n=1 Tax=Dendropsophus ebraccatus TaxID=150705 RepID=UPI0038311C8A